MPVPHVDVQNGSVVDGPLTYGCQFVWVNPSTTAAANLGSCGGFCTQASYTVPMATAAGNGKTPAQILAAPTNFTFTDSGWNAPGTPRIVVTPEPVANKKEVA